MNIFKNTINKILRTEYITRGDSKVYLRRWTLFRSKPRGIFSIVGLGDRRIYIHKFLHDDCADLHCHPNGFISIGLWGKYLEEAWVPSEKDSILKTYTAPFFRRVKASHTHRISLIDNKPCWTLVFMGPKIREWGFYKFINGKRKWLHWKSYVELFGGAGDEC